MATDMNRLQGEVIENPKTPSLQGEQDDSVERMVIGFLRALLDEQRPKPAPKSTPSVDSTMQDEIPAYLQRREAPSPARPPVLTKESV